MQQKAAQSRTSGMNRHAESAPPRPLRGDERCVHRVLRQDQVVVWLKASGGDAALHGALHGALPPAQYHRGVARRGSPRSAAPCRHRPGGPRCHVREGRELATSAHRSRTAERNGTRSIRSIHFSTSEGEKLAGTSSSGRAAKRRPFRAERSALASSQVRCREEALDREGAALRETCHLVEHEDRDVHVVPTQMNGVVASLENFHSTRFLEPSDELLQ